MGDTVRDRLATAQPLKKLRESPTTPDAVIEELFISTLSRRPTANEKAALRVVVGEAGKDQGVYEDILWSLLNSSEFGFNH